MPCQIFTFYKAFYIEFYGRFLQRLLIFLVSSQMFLNGDILKPLTKSQLPLKKVCFQQQGQMAMPQKI